YLARNRSNRARWPASFMVNKQSANIGRGREYRGSSRKGTHMKKYAALACVLALVAASPRAQGKRFITEKDLFRFTWIADPQISPDGATVASVRVTVNEKENRYETSLFAVPASGAEAPRRLTSGIRDTAPRWSPDGKRVAFVRAVEKDGKPQP